MWGVFFLYQFALELHGGSELLVFSGQLGFKQEKLLEEKRELEAFLTAGLRKYREMENDAEAAGFREKSLKPRYQAYNAVCVELECLLNEMAE